MQAENPSGVLAVLTDLEQQHGTLALDDQLPSLYVFKGVALFELNRLREAVTTFHQAVAANPQEVRAWINLIQTQSGIGENPDQAIRAVEMLTGKPFLLGRFDQVLWQDLELHVERNYRNARACLASRDETYCDSNSISATIVRIDDPMFVREMNELFWQFSLGNRSARAMPALPPSASLKHTGKTTLNLGIILTRFDASPVPILAQGFFAALMRRGDVHLTAFVMTDQHHITAPWVENMMTSFHQIFYFDKLSAEECAAVIHAQHIDVLVEMNGLGLQTGLTIMAYRPALVQMSYLGDPYSVGSHHIDYFVGDPVASPPESAVAAFTERLLLLPASYMMTSHAVWQPSVLSEPRLAKHELAKYLEMKVPASAAHWKHKVLLGSFHGHSKVDPEVFGLWMNILRRAPQGYLVLSSNKRSGTFVSAQTNINRLQQAAFHGINQQVNFLAVLQPDVHLHVKTTFDLFLDTLIKNGHSTTVDAVWAGIPVVGLRDQVMMAARSSASITHYLGSDHGMVPSLKAYEDLVIAMISSPRKLAAWRKESEQRRSTSSFFDIASLTEEMVSMFHGAVEANQFGHCVADDGFCEHTKRRPSVYEESGGNAQFHLFASYARDP